MPKKTSTKRILLLEDEKNLAGFYAAKLEGAGYEVKVLNGTEGLLKKCIAFKPDLTFVDHSLGETDQSGTEAIPILRECNPDMQIVMLTNYSEYQIKEHATKAGADDYLLKINTPPDILVAYVKQHC